MRKKYLWLAGGLALAALVVGLIVYRTWGSANQTPTASFRIAPDSGVAPFDVTFDGTSSTDPDGTIAGFAWDYGNGQTGTGSTATHRYTAPGTFTLTLTVTDDRGGTHSATKTVLVTEPRSPVYHPPVLGEIEPPDGAVVRGADTWIRWSAPEAKGQVQWRKAGETDFRTVLAIDGDQLLARLAPLEVGGAYEYIVETRAGEETQRSGLRKFKVLGGLTFEPVAEQVVQRDYDQTVKLTLKNTSDQKVTVGARALVRFADLPADVVGPGSADQPAELAPGQSLDLRLSVTAPDATRETYDIPVEAAGASTVAKVRIAPTKFKLAFRVVGEDPRTLAKTVEVRNEGDNLSNLSIRVVDPNHRDVRLSPGVDHAFLGAGKSLTLIAEPVLYLEFTGLKAELECRAAGQVDRYEMEFLAPKGKRLIGLRGGSGDNTSGKGGFCTNKPDNCSNVPGGNASGPATSPAGPNVGWLRPSFPLGTILLLADPPADGPLGSRPREGQCEIPNNCRIPCLEKAQALKRQIDDIDRQIRDKVEKLALAEALGWNQTPPILRRELDALQKQKDSLVDAYVKHRLNCIAHCGVDVGSLSGSYGPPLLPVSPGATDEYKKKLKDQWRAMVSHYSQLYVDTGESIYQDVAVRYAQLVKDPPSPDFADLVKPVVQPAALREGATESERLAWATAEAQRWHLAYLDAYLTSYERYQGAEAAKNKQGMLRQAKAMEHFADLAIQASGKATLHRHDFERLILSHLEKSLNSAAKGTNWPSASADWLKSMEPAGLPSHLPLALVAAGVTKHADSKAYRAKLQELTFEQAKKVLTEWQQDLRFDEEMRQRARMRGAWPQPPDLGVLYSMEFFARVLWEPLTKDEPHPGHDDADSDRVAAQMRLGLFEALQRQASFTRAHRGPFAAPVEGDIKDSSDTAAGYHADDRVCFAWHQKEQVFFVGFDPRGETLLAPQIIGNGRWPRVTAEGKRTAVTWDRGDGSVVRVHDGEKWREEVPLNGKEAAAAFAPGGQLFAATSAGLWKLSDKVFEEVQKAEYSQPALVIDKDGKPQVAYRKDGRIVFGVAAVDDGERPTMVLAADGTLHLAYLAKGDIALRSRKGDAWTAAELVPAKNPSWPALATGSDGLRLTYRGAAEKGPDALWLIRLPDKQPILMPSLAGNVTDVHFLLHFRLNYERWHYRPHDVWVAVNDVVVGKFDNTVPEGRYLYKLNPDQVFTSPGRPVPNRVALRSWHTNGGNYSTAGDYQLITRTAWSEWFAFASDEAEARKALAERPGLNHDRPDLAVLANSLDLPTQPPKDGVTDFAVTVANLGEGSSTPAQLAMFAGDRRLMSAMIPPLKPGEKHVGTLRLEGRVASVTFKLEQAKPDFDPGNDTLTLHLWDERDPSLTKEPVARAGPGTAVGLDLLTWKQQGPKANGNWVLSKDGKSVLQTINGDPTFFVSPDEYIDVTLRGVLTVEGTGDDDYIGFVFGYKSPLGEKDDKDAPYDFLLFDWKSLLQDNCQEGFALARVKGKLAGEEGFWDRKEGDRFKVLASDYGAGKGWRHKKYYAFELIYQKDRVRIAIDGKPLFDVKGEFQPGRFGFYNYSQEAVRYSNFTVTLGEPAVAKGGVRLEDRIDIKSVPPPEGAVLLFGGKDVSEWNSIIPAKKPWKVVEGGAMRAEEGGMLTRQTFEGSYRLHVEFRVPDLPRTKERAERHTGVFAHFGYEVRIRDGLGLEAGKDGGGALVGVAAPGVNACKAAGVWQSYDIDFRQAKCRDGKVTEGARLTVFHNGVKIHDNVELREWTLFPYRGDPCKPHGIMLQCRGDPVEFRNIWLHRTPAP